MVGKVHEFANGIFSQCIDHKFLAMDMLGEIEPMRSARCKTPTRGKEPDSSYKPQLVRPTIDGWPTLVLEIGVSEPLADLQEDAKWWLANSEKNVNTVILIFVDRENEYLIFQKWEIVEVPNIRVTRRRGQTVGVPMLRGEVEIVGTTVIGGKNDEDDKDDEDEEDEDSVPKRPVDPSLGPDGTDGYLGVRPDDSPGRTGGDCRCLGWRNFWVTPDDGRALQVIG